MPRADAEDRREQADAAGHLLARELVADDPEREREDPAGGALDEARDDDAAPSELETAASSVPPARITSVNSSRRSLPYMSPSRPRIAVPTDAESRYAVSSQVMPVSVVCRSCCIVGSAGTTAELSIA